MAQINHTGAVAALRRVVETIDAADQAHDCVTAVVDTDVIRASIVNGDPDATTVELKVAIRGLLSGAAPRGNPNPGAGQDIRTYTVDQLLAQAREPGTDPRQMHGEIERRARVLDGEQAEGDY